MIKITAAMLGAMLAFASDAPGAAEAEATAKVKSPDEKVCRNGKPTGTRMVTRICKTRAEWKQVDALNQRAVDSSMSRSQVEIRREDFQRGF